VADTREFGVLIVYWVLFLSAAIPAVFERERRVATWHGGVLAVLCLTYLIVAFRESGGDWITYLEMFYSISLMPFTEALNASDPAYGALNWISNRLGLGLPGVNAVCTLIFVFAFAKFSYHEPRPLLMLAVAMAYLIIVVVVGYTRQGTAISLSLLALRALTRRQPVNFSIWILAAISFHRSAAILFPLAYLAMPVRSGWLGRIMLAVTITAAAALLFRELTAQADQFYYAYVIHNQSSSGAAIRAAMNLAAALMFLWHWRAWGAKCSDRDIWLVYAVLAVCVMPLLAVATTAADRIGLYLMPLQLVVFARLPVLQATEQAKTIWATGTVFVYGLAFAIWLHRGDHAAILWLPYESILLTPIFGPIP
jgi:EpsG family